jgi:hypothetical protein
MSTAEAAYSHPCALQLTLQSLGAHSHAYRGSNSGGRAGHVTNALELGARLMGQTQHRHRTQNQDTSLHHVHAALTCLGGASGARPAAPGYRLWLLSGCSDALLVPGSRCDDDVAGARQLRSQQVPGRPQTHSRADPKRTHALQYTEQLLRHYVHGEPEGDEGALEVHRPLPHACRSQPLLRNHLAHLRPCSERG